jgi:hypothetical protein
MIKIDLGHGYTGGAWEWALETFGTSGVSGKDRWGYGGSNVYYFRDEADAALFLLRWS